MNLADNLKKIRKENQLSQEQLAEKLGVSRQSVSKWESGQSYPEMDKVLQICQIFHLNVNELINENISEVNEQKEAKKTSNKYISSFFDYLTKVVDMFTVMKFKQIVFCLFEQIVVASILCCIFLILGELCSGFFQGIFGFLPSSVYSFLFHFVEGIYFVVATVIGVAIFLHIFNIRYLDYYEIVRETDSSTDGESNREPEENTTDKEDKIDNENHKIYLEKRQEKIIIRDPKHSEFKFLSGLGKLVLFFCKCMACFLLVSFAFLFLFFVACMAFSFLFFKTGLLFISVFVVLLGCILLNYVLLELIYNFIVSKKMNKSKIFVLSILSIFFIGFGTGLSLVAATEFDYVEKEVSLVKDTYELDMRDNLRFYGAYHYHNITYVEKDIPNVVLEVEHPDYTRVSFSDNNDFIGIYVYGKDTEIMNLIRTIIKDINDKKISSYNDDYQVVVYSSKENIEKMKDNTEKYYDRNERLMEENENLREENNQLNERIYDLEEIIENSSADVLYDNEGKITGIQDRLQDCETE